MPLITIHPTCECHDPQCPVAHGNECTNVQECVLTRPDMGVHVALCALCAADAINSGLFE